jgi:uncharacterized protein YkuJ
MFIFCYHRNEIEQKGVFPVKSHLKAIISRLEAMVESTDSDTQMRRFEKEGELKAEVTFNKEDQTFIMKDIDGNFTSTFDDIDIVAMEIYDLLF